MSIRNKVLLLACFVVVMLFFMTDPDFGLITNMSFGAGTVASLLYIAKGLLAATLLYIVRKVMHDYPVADFEKLGEEAKKSPVGAGQYAISISLMTIAYSIVIVGAMMS